MDITCGSRTCPFGGGAGLRYPRPGPLQTRRNKSSAGGGETSVPCASEKPAHGQEAVRDCTHSRQTKTFPSCPRPKARDARRPYPARDSELRDDQGPIRARPLSDFQDPGEG